RHTRFSRDWSSDVCSSDLQPGKRHEIRVVGQAPVAKGVIPDVPGPLPGMAAQRHRQQVERMVGNAGIDVYPAVIVARIDEIAHRSEERRVGKECRSSW